MTLRARAVAWRRLGLSLAALALVLQAAVPLFILVDLRALAAEQAADAVIGQNLCIHDGGAGHAPAQPCDMAVCPLCAALAVASALGPPAPGAPLAPSAAPAAQFAFLSSSAAPHDAHAAPYRSRAPPAA
jgi:hypothetical protein